MVFSRRRRIKSVAVDPATGEVISPLPFIGVGLVLASLFLYVWAFWSIPTPAAIALTFTWLVLLLLCFRWWSERPRLVLAFGVVAFVWWFVAVVTGGILLDWGS
ncbi:hypothetical protein ACFQ0K_16315 [Nocardioides caeni]|uniref:Uncharacterized protein n=1 Tax=Nocardioides caeni TaxID=574700 RepID=A0A4S8NLT8_9ACTN|nr:hypothetical protein [Nocardioides caeni]THV16109.1 hypothetical protein E9934_07200 [Nocardioides caeni]